MTRESQFSHEGSLYVISELASAHQGSFEQAIELIDCVCETGADAMKFQLYKYDELTTPYYKHHDRYKEIFFTLEQETAFIDHCVSKGLDVWADVFDRWGLEVARLNRDKIKAIKIPPTVILDRELAGMIMELGLPVAIGVGGYEDEKIDEILSELGGFENDKLLMYGFQGYPTQQEDTSLGRIAYLKGKYKLPIGFADHVDADSEMAMKMPEYAYFCGASVIEKHITLDRKAKGYDHYSSLEPEEFGQLVRNLRQCRDIFGQGNRISANQKNYLAAATRITTTKSIKSGSLIHLKDIKFRRTADSDALFPNERDDYFPAVSLRDIDADKGVSKDSIRKAVIGITVICRLNSSRLPRKAVLDLNGVSAIERCIINTLSSKHSTKTVLATSTNPDDAELEEYVVNDNVGFFRGSEDDPAERMLDAAEKYGFDIIVRVTGDSPLISYELIDILIESHLKSSADYSYFLESPKGTVPEIINCEAIKKLKSLTDTDGFSEYMSLYFRNNPDIFTVNEVLAPEEFRFPEYRLNLDYPEDYELQKKIFDGLQVRKESVSLSKVVSFLKEHPDLLKINSKIKPVYESKGFSESMLPHFKLKGTSKN